MEPLPSATVPGWMRHPHPSGGLAGRLLARETAVVPSLHQPHAALPLFTQMQAMQHQSTTRGHDLAVFVVDVDSRGRYVFTGSDDQNVKVRSNQLPASACSECGWGVVVGPHPCASAGTASCQSLPLHDPSNAPSQPARHARRPLMYADLGCTDKHAGVKLPGSPARCQLPDGQLHRCHSGKRLL